MWFILGMLAGMAIAEGDADRLCPDLSYQGCRKQPNCTWESASDIDPGFAGVCKGKGGSNGGDRP